MTEELAGGGYVGREASKPFLTSAVQSRAPSQPITVELMARLFAELQAENWPDPTHRSSMRATLPRKSDRPAKIAPRGSTRGKAVAAAPASSLAEAVSRFGTLATSKLSNPSIVGQPEDQLRTPVEILIRDIGGLCAPSWHQGISLVGESALSELKSRPDFAVTLGGALAGFIELKAPGKGADPRKFRDRHDKEQWERLRLLPNLIYTDGNEFGLWRDGQFVASVQLTGDVATSGASLEAPDTLKALIETFLRWAPAAPRGARELADVSARLCRLLRDEVTEQLKIRSPGLAMLETAWRKALFPNATDEQFADGYAQAVTFGMLMARARGIALHDLDRAAQQLGDTLIGAALRVLTFSDRSSKPIAALETMSRVLDAVDWQKVSNGNPDSWLYFYEDFLAEYDGDLRKQTGSYYTPAEVVGEMVRLVDEVLRSRFGLPDGLASEAVTIADPAVGTGTFLLGVLRKIAASVTLDQGPGAVPGAIDAAIKRLIAFDVQLGPFAVAQMRLLAELQELIGDLPASSPRMFIADTLANPFVAQEWLGPILEPIAESRRQANLIKRDERIMVVLGNPPYKDKAKELGGWIVQGDAGGDPPLQTWIPPQSWGQGAQVRHLHNLYVYFWRWATWKAFDQYPDANSGIVCFVSSAAFLNGAAFEKMRDYLRRTTDEIWVIDCSPEGHQPDVSTRFFGGVQQPVCIVLACRSANTDRDKPAKVRFRALPEGHRKSKFEALRAVTLDDDWEECPTDWRSPFRPASTTEWLSYPSLAGVFKYDGNGSMIGRTWVVAPDSESLVKRWDKLRAASAADVRVLFQPHTRRGQPGDRHADKVLGSGLPHFETRTVAVAEDGDPCMKPVGYGFRSFDRQYIIPDNRLINVPNMTLWESRSKKQLYLTAPMDRAATGGPAVTATALVPDAHHYNGRGGRVFMLWTDATASESNIRDSVLATLSQRYGRAVSPEDLFAYVLAVSAHPGFTRRFAADMAKPGIRIPITANADLFLGAVALGRIVGWTQTFGERFVNPAEGRPAQQPRLTKEPPKVPAGGAISGINGDLPDTMTYDAAKKRLHVGEGYIEGVPEAVWRYEVSGMPVLKQWFSYRCADRDRPAMGRRASTLSDIKPNQWPAEYTAELLRLINVLGCLVEVEPQQEQLLSEICAGPMISAEELGQEEAFPTPIRRKPARRSKVNPAQLTMPLPVPTRNKRSN